MIDLPASPRVAVIGGGRFARSLLRTMPDRICGLVVRNNNIANELQTISPGTPVVTRFQELDPSSYDIVWIATSDTAIREVAQKIAGDRDDWNGIIAIHSSGATSPDTLSALKNKGAIVFALHPNGAFTGEMPVPPGLVWSISSGGEEIEKIVLRLLDTLAPHIVVVDDEHRALYHAAASVASNYSVTLFGSAVELYRRAGLSDSEARDVVARFIIASAERSALLGARDALTGPVTRGDHDIVAGQADAVRRFAPEYLESFIALALQTAELFEPGSRERWRKVLDSERGEDDVSNLA